MRACVRMRVCECACAHLCLREEQVGRDFEALGARQVLVEFELTLELEELLTREGGTRTPRLPQQPRLLT